MKHSPSILSAQLFGDFRLRLAGSDALPRGRKAAGLLAFLATIEDRNASRARLADLLWGDRGEEQARSSLRQVILELKASAAAASGAILVARSTIGFVPNGIVTDIAAIRAAAMDGDSALLATLLEQLRGQFLENMDGLSPAFDDWLSSERPRQEESLFAIVLSAMPKILERAERGNAHRILGALERLDPLNEPVTRLRMQLDHEGGDLASMHRRFRRLSDELARELGVAPSHATSQLFDSLLSRQIQDVPPKSPQVVPPPAVMVGRTPPAIFVAPLTATGMAESAEIATICTEDVRTALARNGELRVLMIDSADEARFTVAASNAIAAYRLSGSLRTIGDQTSVNIELGSIETGLITWSEKIRFTGSPFELIDEIVARIVAAVGPAVERDLSMALDAHPTDASVTREAALLYARGRRLAREARSLEEIRVGADLLEAALRHDPRHVGARIRLSNLYNTDFSFLLAGHDVPAFRARASQLIEEAIALDPGNIRVQIRVAWCSLRRGEWQVAQRLFRQAIEVMPYDADTLNECAFGLACIGDLDLAWPLMQRAFQLNPFAPNEYHADHAVLLALAGKTEAAEEHFQICGERRLFYQAIRLGNLLRLDPGSARLHDLQRQFVQAFSAIWQPDTPPDLADLADWVDHSISLHKPEHRQLVIDGVVASWSMRSQAAHDRNA